MNADTKWEILKDEMSLAVEEGRACGFDNITEETINGGEFFAFEYVLKRMDALDERK